MVIRTLDGFQAHLSEDLKWRLYELDNWESLVNNCRPHQQTAALRAGVALLYAHWEGYVKEATRAYLEFVSRKGLKLGQLRAELAAVALRGVLGTGQHSKRASDHTAVIEALRDEMHRMANLPYARSTIKTHANLAFGVFEDIMHSVGCDASRHEIARTLIDSRLLKNRNDIAHGRELQIALDDWVLMRKRIVDILRDVRAQLDNAATLEKFRLDSNSQLQDIEPSELSSER